MGSSPRVRGAELTPAGSVSTPGLIPAGAGSGPSVHGFEDGTGAHPRGCGERRASRVAGRLRKGSSPQARGAVDWWVGGGTVAGLIPAGAGSGSCRKMTRWSVRAHPRRRGERIRLKRTAQIASGSSLQARGAGGLVPGDRAAAGLIPAGAGSGRSSRRLSVRFWAHPRRRGERDPWVVEVRRESGSSPQARGAGQVLGGGGDGEGLIPAGAGSGGRRWRPLRCRGAHPRRRGERVDPLELHPPPGGSSPQARGAGGVVGVVVGAGGLIPAGAGSGSRTSGVEGPRRAHPRRRGERFGP